MWRVDAAEEPSCHDDGGWEREFHGAAQAGLKEAERRQNVRGAFRADPGVRGKRVLLVDDVMTTGSTIEECARALRRAGAHSVHVLSLARSVLR